MVVGRAGAGFARGTHGTWGSGHGEGGVKGQGLRALGLRGFWSFLLVLGMGKGAEDPARGSPLSWVLWR